MSDTREPNSDIRFSDFHFGAKLTEQTRNKKKYNNLEEINRLGAQYARNPTPEDGELLIRAFHGFLMKYVQLLVRHNTSNIKISLTSDTKDFLKLFISKEQFQAHGSRAFQQTLARLPNMATQSLMNADDIYNELVAIFLEKAQSFNPNIGGFTGYIKYSFKYAVKSRLFQTHNDALNYQPLYEQPVDEESFFGHDIDVFDNGMTRVKLNYDIADDMLVNKYIDLPKLDLSLVNNPTPPFDTLWTKQERMVLVKIYVEDKNFNTIANELGYSDRKPVIQLHESAIKKMREYLQISKDPL